MRIFVLFFMMLMTVSSYVFAETTADKISVLTISSELNYKKIDADKQVNENTLHSMIKINSNNLDWVMMGQYQSPLHADTFVLLSKIEKMNANGLVLHLLMVDLNKKTNLTFSPKITVKYGQVKKIKINNEAIKIQLAVNASKDKDVVKS